MVQIFSKILTFFLSNFEKPVFDLVSQMVGSAIAIFDKVGEDLLPTPAKSHYTFNLRDIWKVFQGVCSVSNKKVSEAVVMIRCWSHENFRVYGDRLINEADRKWFKDLVSSKI